MPLYIVPHREEVGHFKNQMCLMVGQGTVSNAGINTNFACLEHEEHGMDFKNLGFLEKQKCV